MNPAEERKQQPQFPIDDLDYPPVSFEQLIAAGLKPEEDPYGMNYEYLRLVPEPRDAAISKFSKRSPEELVAFCARKLRDIVGSDTIASRTDDEFLKQWVISNYPRMCVNAGEDGELNFRLLKSHGMRMETFIGDALEVLNQQAELTALSLEDKVALAVLIVDHYRPKKRKK